MIKIATLFINEETGEFIRYDESVRVITKSDEVKSLNFTVKIKNDSSFRTMQNDYLGMFVFYVYNNIDTLEEKLGSSDCVKFIFLGSYVKDDGYLRHDNKNTNMTKKDIEKIMKLSKSSFAVFYKKLLEFNLLVVNDYGIKINSEYFKRGKQNKTLHKEEGIVRIYTSHTRQLYNDTNKSSLRKLIIIYKLLPLVHWSHNSICYNPNEINIDDVVPMKIGDVSDYLGYDKTHITRFEKDLYSLKIGDNFVFGTFRVGAKENTHIVVNPRIYHKGNNEDGLRWLVDSFGLSKSSHLLDKK